MKKVNEFVEELRKGMRTQIREKMNNDQDAYKELLKNLLIQVSILIPRSFLYRASSNLWRVKSSLDAESLTCQSSRKSKTRLFNSTER